MRWVLLVMSLLVLGEPTVRRADTHPRLSEKAWVALEPEQCGGAPWIGHWMRSGSRKLVDFPHSREGWRLDPREAEIIRHYYGRLGFPVSSLAIVWDPDGTCDACFCPIGYTLYLSVWRTHAWQMVTLGFREESPEVDWRWEKRSVRAGGSAGIKMPYHFSRHEERRAAWIHAREATTRGFELRMGFAFIALLSVPVLCGELARFLMRRWRISLAGLPELMCLLLCVWPLLALLTNQHEAAVTYTNSVNHPDEERLYILAGWSSTESAKADAYAGFGGLALSVSVFWWRIRAAAPVGAFFVFGSHRPRRQSR